MGISFGSNGVKPYVGGSEIQEAYVGSQLVYKSRPPYTYAFLGGESNYFIADWCSLVRGATVVKDEGKYRISMAASSTSNPYYFRLTEIHGPVIKFQARRAGGTTNIKPSITFRTASGGIIGTSNYLNLTTEYALYSYTLPAGTQIIQFNGNNPEYTGSFTYFDAIRYEES